MARLNIQPKSTPSPREDMRLPTRVHGFLDYLSGALFMGLPWIAGFARGGAETWTLVLVGGAALLYSACTDYELGVVRRLPMTTHLLLDGVGGAFLAASPWLFGFDQTVWLPHLLAGLWSIVAATVTNTIPGYERRRADQR
jgi:hypothetical protein